jgi:hypothetical protein
VRRPLLALGALVVLAAVAMGGVAVGLAVGDDESQSISDAEHNRLLSVCIRESDEPAVCAPWVADVVDETVDEGCGYHEAAQVIAAWFDVDSSSERQFRRDRTEIYAQCDEDER